MDQTAILVAHSKAWSGVPPRLGTASPVTSEMSTPDCNTTRIGLRSARYAAAAFPGPVGELISQEIRAYVASGIPVPRYAMARRLIAAMASREQTHPLPPIPNAAPRYVPGTPLQFRSPTAADEPEDGGSW